MDLNKDIFIMSRQTVQRHQIIRKVLDGEINQQEAAQILRRSDRQIRRIVKRVRQQGPAGTVHGLRSKRGNRNIAEGIKQEILKIYRKSYEGFGPKLASEKLAERDGIKISDETLRLWLIKEGLWKVKRSRSVKSLSWRERKSHCGEMVQMDGSQHDWLEGRGPKMVLMGYIDDATGRVYGEFYGYEGTRPAMGSLKGYIKKYGIPKSIYLDKHATYKVNKAQRYKDWPFRDREELTQFARSCRQLGIELIYAHSPQAKGRIERVFGTLQDRLTKEMRLEGVRTIDEANRFLRQYLPKFNRKFNVLAKRTGDYHCKPENINIKEILSIQTEHPLRNDRTIVHQKQWYQVLSRTRARKVMVYEYPNGQMAIKDGAQSLAFKRLEDRLPQAPVVKQRRARPRYRLGAAKGSYWRDGFKLPGSLPARN